MTKKEEHFICTNNWWKPSLVLAGCLAMAKPELTSCFTSHTKTPPTTGFRSARRRIFSNESRTNTRLYYRVEGDSLPFLADSSSVNVINKESYDKLNHLMPVWLRQFKGGEISSLFEKLKQSMANSYMTEDDAADIISLIEDFGQRDSNKMAGAVQLCLILVETMDMGFETLIAAVFHYYSCVEARENNLLPTHFPSKPANGCSSTNINISLSHIQSLCRETKKMKCYGEGVKTIVEDAASLKKTEMKAASIMRTSDVESLRRLLLAETGDWRALAIRSAAALFRLRAVEEMKISPKKKLSSNEIRVAKEALHIYAPLASGLGIRRLKEELENSAFSVLYKRQDRKVTSLMNQPRTKIDTGNGERWMSIKDGLISIEQDVSGKLRTLLENDPMFKRYADNVVVSARIKEPFSLWRKMLKLKVKNVLDVPDALALRVTFDAKKLSLDEDIEVTRARERALCYYVKKLCTGRWLPDQSNPRFKDYIKNPKKNGYQSLHYTAKTEFGGADWLFEIQIRSGEMHRVAEYGLAAHWDYKLQGNEEGNYNKNCYQLDHSSEAYLRSVQAWYWEHSDTNSDSPSFMKFDNFFVESKEDPQGSEKGNCRVPYIKHMSSVRSRMTRNEVLVFLSPTEGSTRDFDGKILSLPSGSCVLDALKLGEELYGITTNFWGVGVVQNDNEASLTQRLMNGDVLRIPEYSGRNLLSV